MISGFEVQYQVGNVPSGQDTFERMAVAFERAGDELADMGKYVFPKLIAVFEAALERQFDSQGRGPHAGAWAQLSEKYAAWKELNFPGMPILQRDGTLSEALTQSSSPYALRRVSTDEMEFGTTGVEYASFHQTGTDRMVDRPPLDFDADVEREIRRAGHEGARDALKQARVDEFADLSDFHDS